MRTLRALFSALYARASFRLRFSWNLVQRNFIQVSLTFTNLSHRILFHPLIFAFSHFSDLQASANVLQTSAKVVRMMGYGTFRTSRHRRTSSRHRRMLSEWRVMGWFALLMYFKGGVRGGQPRLDLFTFFNYFRGYGTICIINVFQGRSARRPASPWSLLISQLSFTSINLNPHIAFHQIDIPSDRYE